MTFSGVSKPSACEECKKSACVAGKEKDDALAKATAHAMERATGNKVDQTASDKLDSEGTPYMISADSSKCKRMAYRIENEGMLRRFNRYRETLPYARAASDMNKLGDDPKPPKTREPKQPKGPCLTRLPVNAKNLCSELGLKPGTISDTDLRNDMTGFRAAMYRDEASGKLIMVARDTQRTSLVDWQTNTRNGEGKDTKQYAAMRELSRKLAKKGVAFDVAGYSKGGGLAQEAALVNTNAKAYVFNSAGLPNASLKRTGNTDFTSLAERTHAFSAENDFLTYMNTTKDPDQQIKNVKWLQNEIKGKNRPFIDPMKINHRNPAQPKGKDDSAFKEDLKTYMKEFDDKIAGMEADRAAGRTVNAFPPVRAGHQETIAGSSLNSASEGPNLGKLAQHQMKNVLHPMEHTVEKDKKALHDFLKCCG